MILFSNLFSIRAKPLGKRNIKTLQEHAMNILRTSWFLFVDAVEIKAELSRNLDEISANQETLEAEIEAQLSRKDAPNASKPVRRAAQKRISALEAAVEALHNKREDSEVLLLDWKDVLSQRQTRYREALELLRENIAAMPR